MLLIATRNYHDFNPATGEEFELQDRMYRKACGSFVLMRAGERPGDPEDEQSFSLAEVFAWLSELPWQIERAVYVGQRKQGATELGVYRASVAN